MELGLRVRDNTRVELGLRVRDNTRVELGLRVRDNTRAVFVIPRGSLSGTLRGIHAFRGVGNVDLGLRVGMLRGNPRMARGKGAPRGRRVEKSPKCRSSTTYINYMTRAYKPSITQKLMN